ncbi:sodium/potassium-transporting ATPase subunit alpha-B-like [Paramacrobiotus metropolitanus]|uniref:sodium/potassium-transporting ATPase subunit alpha-B-like n=1 Tax=Paramacrobiotus metropolitanus TaxID=2943436 RepID=UPI002445BAFE|nr:sodium/potassium-transporting ATPase subunit alpha-B-like [Paramacrobiotus metropolitanus]XP_055353101.1 sodium/potassium-transporting ATPase subunit alpha-B-like [Paramacrobiotus metropolitanus]
MDRNRSDRRPDYEGDGERYQSEGPTYTVVGTTLPAARHRPPVEESPVHAGDHYSRDHQPSRPSLNAPNANFRSAATGLTNRPLFSDNDQPPRFRAPTPPPEAPAANSGRAPLHDPPPPPAAATHFSLDDEAEGRESDDAETAEDDRFPDAPSSPPPYSQDDAHFGAVDFTHGLVPPAAHVLYGDRRHSSPASHFKGLQRPAEARPEQIQSSDDEPVPPHREGASAPTPVPAPRVLSPSRRAPPASCTIACQVEEDELLSKTISTQVNESDLRTMDGRMPPRSASHARFKLDNEDTVSNDTEKDDTVSQHLHVQTNPLRNTPSCQQLHGILRKTPSAKFGSQSTFPVNDTLSTSNFSLNDTRHSQDNLRKSSAFSSQSDTANGNGKNGKHKGSRLALFHLGAKDHDDHDHSDAGSVHGGMPSVKHASFAQLPADTTGEGPPKEAWWRRCLPCKSKKNLPRSFTMDDLKKDLTMDEHMLPLDDLFAKLDVNPQTGVSEEEAAKRLQRDGKNMLTPPKQVPEIVKILREFVGGFSPLLEIGAALSFIAFGIQVGTSDDAPYDNLYLGIVLICVVLITGGFLYYQNAKSEAIMEGFKKMMPQSANVLRNGKIKEISADNVVLGDIVEVKAGDRIPADIRILECKTLKVDNSSLTGESEPQSRSPEGSDNPLESKNLIFYTSNAVEGFGRGVVIKRGDNTVMGRIAKLTTRLDTSETTIAREMRHFVTLICILAVTMGVLCIVIALALGYDGFYAIILAIGLVVANVPEGIMITVTVMLTLTAKRMAKKNCLIKNLEAVETLGACSVICSDKTGTLTQNRMTVAHAWVDEQIVATDTATESLAGKELPDTTTCKALLNVAILCNRAAFKDDQGDKPVYARECKGDASETALLKFTEILTGDVMAERAKHKAVAEIPFNSTTKFQVSVHEMHVDGRLRYLVAMKGAPERIWDRCSSIGVNNKDIPKNRAWTDKFNDAYLDLGSRGERVLGFCDLLLPEDEFPQGTKFDTEKPNFPMEGMRFVGLISLIDPPRAAVPDAVAKCRSAGVQVIMVTGDHPVTAKAIARSVGIISEGMETAEDVAHRLGIEVSEVEPADAKAIVVHGGELREMKDEDIDSILMNHAEIVFARTSPQQKLIIVEACQRAGAVVAVTGDGVNDSPALKKANIGIAMGITGSDVSKQAADIVLLDDNFASIIIGIEEGRLIFDNLKKTICYTLMSNIPEIAPVVIYFFARVPLGLTTIPMLLVCLGTDMLPSISMAHESAEADIMKLPPRSPDERLVSFQLLHCCYMQAGMICAVGAFFTYFVVLGEMGFRPYDVVGVRDYWENPALSDVADSYGQEWTYPQRMLLQRTVDAAFFASIVVFQWVDLICRKVRRKSVLQKPMTNWFMNLSLVFETAVTIFCIYVPYLNYALSLYTIRFVWWLPMIPFALFFFVFDELRRFIIRRFPDGWMERNFYM